MVPLIVPAFSLLTLALAAATVQDAPAIRELPVDISGPELRKRVRAAIGQEDAWSHVKTLRSRGALEIEGVEGAGTFEELKGEGGRVRLRISMPGGGGETLEGCDGPVAWEKDDEGVRDLKGAELVEALDDCVFLAPFDLDSVYKEITIAGKASQNGDEFYLVDAVRPSGNKEVLTIHARTYLPILALARRHIEGRLVPVPVVMSDYRDVAGLKLPHVLKSKFGSTRVTLTISSYEANVPLDPAAVARPR